MNFSSILSFSIAAAVFFGAVLSSATSPLVFLNLHAALVVFGGTMAAAAVSFQVDRLFLMFKVFVIRLLRGPKFNYVPLIEELMRLADIYKQNPDNLATIIRDIRDPFLREGMNALTENLMPHEDVFRLLSTRAHTVAQRYHGEALRMKAIAKFPPAFGLMSATIGMISLLQNVGSSEGQANVGPAMGIALVGTLYGIAFANLVLLPVSEQLLDSAKEVQIKNRIIIEGLKLIASRKNPIIVAEELNSFLLAGERIDWRRGVKNVDMSEAA